MTFKMKGAPMQRNFGVGSKPGAPLIEGSAKMKDKDWQAGNVKARQARNNEGSTDLDGLVKRRSAQKKGSDEYKTTQNAINVALGNKTKHETKANSRTAETQEKKAVITEKAIAKRKDIITKAEDNAKTDKAGDIKIDYKAQRKSVKSAQKESRKNARLDVKDARKQHGRGSDEVKEAKADRKANNKANRAQRQQNRKDDKENKLASKKGAPFIGKIIGVAKKVIGGVKKAKDVAGKVKDGVDKVKNMAGF